jgi:hypothetical protein
MQVVLEVEELVALLALDNQRVLVLEEEMQKVVLVAEVEEMEML